MMSDFYTTKVLVEVEVTHQFDSAQGIGIVTGRLTGVDIPAIKSVKVISAESNFNLHGKPIDKMIPVSSCTKRVVMECSRCHRTTEDEYKVKYCEYGDDPQGKNGHCWVKKE